MGIQLDVRHSDLTIVDKALYIHATNEDVIKLTVNDKRNKYDKLATIICDSVGASKTETRTFIEILYMDKKQRELGYDNIIKLADLLKICAVKFDNNKVTYTRAVNNLVAIGMLRTVGFKGKEFTVNDIYNINLLDNTTDYNFILLEIR